MKKKLLAMSVLAAISTQANAFQFDTSDDWEIRWDNTVKANVMSRVARQDKDVNTPRRGAAFFLADDASLSVDRSNGGIVSTRLDVLSEFDVIWRQDFGFRISGSAWYDYAYKDSDHPSDRIYTWASSSVDPGEYSDAADDLHYFGGEILDAFVFGNWYFGDTSLGVRAGRHTIYWGNSLLATGAIAGIGGAMAPLDFSKALSVPGSEAKELFMPTAKISAVFQPTENLTLNAFYNFEHQRYRLPETGTYFSPTEGLTEDTDFITLPPGSPSAPFRTGLSGNKDKHDSGDWGFNVQYFVDAWSLETSFIYLNYVDKNLHGLHAGFDTGQLANIQAASNPLAAVLLSSWNGGCAAGVLEPCPPNDPVIDPGAGTIVYGQGGWLFKDDIDLYAISLAKEIGGISVGADIVLRQDTGLAPDLAKGLQRFYGAPEPFVPLIESALGLGHIPGDYDSYDSSNYLGPVGDVWSVVINGVGLLQSGRFWDGGSYILEATFQMLDDCTENCELLDYRVYEDRVVSTVAAVFRPTWYQVAPGWDLTLPMAVSYTIDGEKSPFTFGGDEERGSGSIGVEMVKDGVWIVDARYNAYFGPVNAGIAGLLKDRDNVSLTVKRTF
ncbi:DUF1302 domain-containing protein [Pseudohalioglobus lutimaris]|uniref:DUF1302 domain-containing protein n=1 Tax=Pseudohalioglobus lutimaris TaxID=1737061 RepID=A0A2N5X2U5_9GAMM|nr:DUF1302 family protein [Pseudohalioglobus lutimaris]PLW68780.1 hypothetical protein C0039_10940 [Pseudohalioglobus lutimaris]